MDAIKYLTTVWLLILGLSGAQAQNEPMITLQFDHQPLSEVLKTIDALPQVKLSYNPASLPSDVIVTKNYVNATVDEVLQDLLGKPYEYKRVGDYIIIQKATPKKNKEKEKQTYKFSGDIKDASTGETLTDVTVYEVNTLDATLSDEKGEFELEVSSRADLATIAVSRKNYQDTIIRLSDLQSLKNDVLLTPRQPAQPEAQEESRFSLESKKLVRFFTSRKNRKNTENVKQVEDRFFQFSLVPAIGTNMSMGGQVRHRLSLNLLAGYSYGLHDGFELGGLYNINRSDVSGVQIAGFGNTTGGTAEGFQLAGFINTSKGYTQAAQIAGFTNIVTDSLRGFQLSGFSNISTRLDGAQISGFSNIAKGRMDGFQLAGFSNHSQLIEGVQLTSVINTAHEIDGMQMSGLLNITNTLKGTQFGIINIADTVESGMQIGLINVVKKNGYLEAAVEYGDLFPVGFAIRSGMHKFYNVFSVNTQLENDRLWAYGFGLGTQFTLKNKLFATAEVRAHYLQKWDDSIETFNLLSRCHINLGYQLLDKFSITGGPVLNIYLAEETGEGTGQYGYDIAHNPFYNEIEENIAVQLWIGYEFSIRF
ncbi:hypothetical protein BFP72_06825 [Reichenbachiella sp. 5M10]|uniref:STN and carboxypeptidase regulatory-like domain-containing protein n=1 Tax=Reichenbachiella sp. 5M10 TaxID=1889772 RepID=UPI000C1570A6|nr:STN and carboxypeptidase regulatory-like domain-containing protein [Reichenbachiella sp. 5M10]PIB35128.1 hypothetical protein BFP72_06825 [Reichenbachiella sp. 5M10]